jgi:hypothetical protein
MCYLEQRAKVLVAGLLVVLLLAPVGDVLAMEDEDVEERVEQQDGVGGNAARVQQHGRGRPIEGVAGQRWLNLSATKKKEKKGKKKTLRREQTFFEKEQR